LAWVLPYAIPAAVVILAHGRILNVLSLDEQQARQLGVNVERTKLILLGAASLAAAAVVSVSGTIGFVGLIVPHAVRLMWGPDNRTLLPMAIVLGAAFLIGADLAARTIDEPSEIPVGIITAFCGVPFFLYLLRRTKAY
jgi:iron complex transport system permease protein